MKEHFYRTAQHARMTWTALTVEILATAFLYMILRLAGISNDISVLLSFIGALVFVFLGVRTTNKFDGRVVARSQFERTTASVNTVDGLAEPTRQLFSHAEELVHGIANLQKSIDQFSQYLVNVQEQAKQTPTEQPAQYPAWLNELTAAVNQQSSTVIDLIHEQRAFLTNLQLSQESIERLTSAIVEQQSSLKQLTQDLSERVILQKKDEPPSSPTPFNLLYLASNTPPNIRSSPVGHTVHIWGAHADTIEYVKLAGTVEPSPLVGPTGKPLSSEEPGTPLEELPHPMPHAGDLLKEAVNEAGRRAIQKKIFERSD